MLNPEEMQQLNFSVAYSKYVIQYEELGVNSGDSLAVCQVSVLIFHPDSRILS